MIAAADAAAASRNTSRGWTTVLSSDPTDRILMRITRCLVSSIDDAELLHRARRRIAAADTPPSDAASVSRGRSTTSAHQRATSELDGGNAPEPRGAADAGDAAQRARRPARVKPLKPAGVLDQPVRQFEGAATAQAASEHERRAARCHRALPARDAPASRAAGRGCDVLSSILNPSCASGAAVVLRASLSPRSSSPPRARLLPTRKWIRRRARSTPRVPRAPSAMRRVDSRPRPTRCSRRNEAVDQRDYRLALNHALESREQAQNAVRYGSRDTRHAPRCDVETLGRLRSTP